MNWREALSELIDTVAYVMAYAPNRFPARDYLPADGRMTLDRIFAEMREELELVAREHGESAEIEKCRTGIEESFQFYNDGHSKEGFLRIQDVLHTLRNL